MESSLEAQRIALQKQRVALQDQRRSRAAEQLRAGTRSRRILNSCIAEHERNKKSAHARNESALRDSSALMTQRDKMAAVHAKIRAELRLAKSAVLDKIALLYPVWHEKEHVRACAVLRDLCRRTQEERTLSNRIEEAQAEQRTLIHEVRSLASSCKDLETIASAKMVTGAASVAQLTPPLSQVKLDPKLVRDAATPDKNFASHGAALNMGTASERTNAVQRRRSTADSSPRSTAEPVQRNRRRSAEISPVQGNLITRDRGFSQMTSAGTLSIASELSEQDSPGFGFGAHSLDHSGKSEARLMFGKAKTLPRPGSVGAKSPCDKEVLAMHSTHASPEPFLGAVNVSQGSMTDKPPDQSRTALVSINLNLSDASSATLVSDDDGTTQGLTSEELEGEAKAFSRASEHVGETSKFETLDSRHVVLSTWSVSTPQTDEKTLNNPSQQFAKNISASISALVDGCSVLHSQEESAASSDTESDFD